MTVPDELVQAVHDATCMCDEKHNPDALRLDRVILDAVPDGWAKIDGEWVQPDVAKMRAALEALQSWDMLTLTADGHGAATADAPWARQLIAEALS